MLDNYLAKERSLNTLSYLINEPLAPHSTFGIGGQCDYFVKPHSENALIQLISVLKSLNIRYTVIGNGSNLLFDDNGYRGCIISTKELRDISINTDSITVSAGYSLIGLSALAQKEGLSGLEFACSIPATVGGAIYMNAGAYGGEMKDIVTSVRYLSDDGLIYKTKEHGFAYRHSAYQNDTRIILSCHLQLKQRSSDWIQAKMLENKAKREASQPTHEKSAGSIFRRTDTCIPAKLIDEAGLKGLSVGNAEVSQKHAGFIINRGFATAQDVLTLIDKIQSVIFERYGIILQPEIRYIPSESR